MPKKGVKVMSVRLFWQIDWRRSTSFADFFTLCGVPLEGDANLFN